jgi:hypothetical protein
MGKCSLRIDDVSMNSYAIKKVTERVAKITEN